MTKPCAVPKCRTGYKSNKEKHSVFSVPKDPARLQKWEELIPGNVKLRAKDVICDKHFEERYIHREWIKYDPQDESKIFARAPYKHPRLSELAIPTRFDENLENERAVASIAKLEAPSLTSPINAYTKMVETPQNCLVPSSSNNIRYDAPSKDKTPVVNDVSPDGLHSHVKRPMNMARELGDNRSKDSGHLLVKCAYAKQPPDTDDMLNNGLPTFEMIKVEVPMEIPDNNIHIESSSTILDANVKPYSVVSTITITDKIQKANSTNTEKYSTDLPNSWSVTELCVERGQRIVFQYIVTKADKGVRIPVLQKCVALDSDRQLEYFVYGRLVEIQGTLLNRTLAEASSLRKTLQAFQYMGICAGLGVPTMNVPIEDAYVDYVQQWRHDNCTLISKQKRCPNCKKLRNRVNSRLRNMKTRPTLKRIHQNASKGFDNRKVVALLKRTAQERQSRKKAEGRATSLRKKLEEVQKNIAYIQESTLQKKCYELNTPEA